MKAMAEKRLKGRIDAAKAKPACPCGWLFPFVKGTGTGLSQVADFTLHVQCPDCGKEFQTDRAYQVEESSAARLPR